MRNTLVSFVVPVFMLCCLIDSAPADDNIREAEWRSMSDGIRDSALKKIKAHPDNADTVYVSSDNTVYKTQDKGKLWREVLSFRGTGNIINSIEISPLHPATIYAGTGEGLYRSGDNGKSWSRIFQSIRKEESSVLSLAFSPLDPKEIFIGTDAGIYRTNDGGTEWARDRNFPSKAPVSFIAIDYSSPHIIYAVTYEGVFSSLNRGADWKKIYHSNLSGSGKQATGENGSEFPENDDQGDSGIEIESAENTEATIRVLAVDQADNRTIYLATAKGLLVSNDRGISWSSLNSGNVRDIVINAKDPDVLYAATDRGVLKYSRERKKWDSLYKGIPTDEVSDIEAADIPGIELDDLWAATKQGVYNTYISQRSAVTNSADLTKVNSADNKDLRELDSLYANEPSIEEICNSAIEYAEVHPAKIEKWRKAAASKAWLPDVRVAYDKSSDWQADKYYYSGHYVEDDITKGRDQGWSIALTWELGDIIYSSDQTSIDSRSRLMVQLRDEILNEVTRLYYERRRLQYEIALSPAIDINAAIEQRLRLQELTAHIDTLTGSYLSKRLGAGKGI